MQEDYNDDVDDLAGISNLICVCVLRKKNRSSTRFITTFVVVSSQPGYYSPGNVKLKGFLLPEDNRTTIENVLYCFVKT